MNKSTDETAAMDRHDEPYKSQLQRIGQAIGYGRAQPAAPADAAPSVAPEPVAWQMIDKHGDTVYVPVTHAIKPDLVLDCDLRHPDNAPHEQRPLFAHPPRAPLSPWQPMKTAPKDGTAVLVLLDASDIPHAARWLSGPDDRRATEETTRAGWHLTWDGSPIEEHDGPRYWMHCPDDPDESDIEAAHGIGGK